MNSPPPPAPTPRLTARAAAPVPATARLLAVVTRASGPVPAVVSAWASRRIPKRGFHNIFAKRLESVNVSVLEKFEDGAVVNAQTLLEKGVLSKCEYGVKILGNGSLTKKLTVQAAAFSASAKEKIEAAGGKVEEV